MARLVYSPERKKLLDWLTAQYGFRTLSPGEDNRKGGVHLHIGGYNFYAGLNISPARVYQFGTEPPATIPEGQWLNSS
jgi:hypothetical protein